MTQRTFVVKARDLSDRQICLILQSLLEQDPSAQSWKTEFVRILKTELFVLDEQLIQSFLVRAKSRIGKEKEYDGNYYLNTKARRLIRKNKYPHYKDFAKKIRTPPLYYKREHIHMYLVGLAVIEGKKSGSWQQRAADWLVETCNVDYTLAYAAMLHHASRGYLDYGTSIAGAWLTPKGTVLFEKLKEKYVNKTLKEFLEERIVRDALHAVDNGGT